MFCLDLDPSAWTGLSPVLNRYTCYFLRLGVFEKAFDYSLKLVSGPSADILGSQFFPHKTMKIRKQIE